MSMQHAHCTTFDHFRLFWQLGSKWSEQVLVLQGEWYHDVNWKEGSWRPALLNKTWSAFICLLFRVCDHGCQGSLFKPSWQGSVNVCQSQTLVTAQYVDPSHDLHWLSISIWSIWASLPRVSWGRSEERGTSGDASFAYVRAAVWHSIWDIQ